MRQLSFYSFSKMFSVPLANDIYIADPRGYEAQADGSFFCSIKSPRSEYLDVCIIAVQIGTGPGFIFV